MFVAALLVGGGAAIAAHSNYSRYSRHSNHSDYSDAAERRRKQREAKQIDLDRSKHRLQEYVAGEIQRLKEQYQINRGLKSWSATQANLQSFEKDYEQYNTEITQTVKGELESQFNMDIAKDEQSIRDIDAIILKINHIQLTRKGS